MRASDAVRFRCSSVARAFAACIVACIAAVAVPRIAGAAEWQPAGIVPATAVSLADVVTLAKASATDSGQRSERWTYTNGARKIAVDVRVRDDDFRTALVLDGLTYTAGRLDGVRWRGDGNGIAHSVLGDDQGDAADAAPQALFRVDWTACTLVGQTRLPMLAYVLETHRAADKPAFLYVDATNGAIVREVFRDGRRVTTTTFDRFETRDGLRRARHWRVDNGQAALAIDAVLDTVDERTIPAADVALPVRRAAFGSVPETTLTLPASFRGGRVNVDAGVNGVGRVLVLDTGTASITLGESVAPKGTTMLEHTRLERVTVGALRYDGVSTLAIPVFGGSIAGILGYDFFFGHVVEIGYVHRRVRVLSAAAAARVFADPATVIIPIDVGLGLPLARATIGPLQSDTFALDTGSPRFYVMRSFAQRNAAEIAAHWTPSGMPFIESYLEGTIEIQPYRISRATFAGFSITDTIVGAQIPSLTADDITLYFDGIIGTDVLTNFDLYFDYDNGRLGLVR